MKNQDKMQAIYNIKDPIEILFNQMYTGQEFTIAGNYPFSDRHLEEMGVFKILATQEYKHAYHMWKIIAENDRTWVRFKEHLQKGGTKSNRSSYRVCKRQEHETW